MRVLSVSQINFFIKSLIEGDGRMRDIYARGEISNFTDHYRSGHLYFSLKDEKSVLKAVMFSSAARRLRFHPKEGMRVIVRGRVAVYEPGGQYQFYVEDMQPDGVGALSLAFEQLKEKLAAEGLFAEEHKRPIPQFPARIGVINIADGRGGAGYSQHTLAALACGRDRVLPGACAGRGRSGAAYGGGEIDERPKGGGCHHHRARRRLRRGFGRIQRRDARKSGVRVEDTRHLRCGARDGFYDLRFCRGLESANAERGGRACRAGQGRNACGTCAADAPFVRQCAGGA